jgi:hypothetical protein
MTFLSTNTEKSEEWLILGVEPLTFAYELKMLITTPQQSAFWFCAIAINNRNVIISTTIDIIFERKRSTSIAKALCVTF